MKIRSFEEYNELRRGKRRWSEPVFDMPKAGECICGLCGWPFQASEYFFLICKSCISAKVDMDRDKPCTDVVYGLYSMNDELLYIGVTNNPTARAHNHMLTKNFKTLKVIRYFSNRLDADNFEKYAINEIKPELNRKFDTDWSSVPYDWSPEEFGKVARPIKIKVSNRAKKAGRKEAARKSSQPKTQNPRPTPCARCGNTVGNKRNVVDGKVFHDKDCKPPVVLTPEQQAKKKEQAKAKRDKNKQDKAIMAACVLCGKKTTASGVIILKDKVGRTGRVHKACYDNRVKELTRRK